MANIVKDKKYELVQLTSGLDVKVHVSRLISMNKSRFHWHKEMEFLLVLDGPVIVHTEEKSFTLQTDDIFIINANELHCVQKTKAVNEVMVMQIPRSFCKVYYPEMLSYKFLDRNIAADEMSNLYTTLYGFLVRIMTSLHHKKEGFRLEVVGLLNLLFHTLLTNTKYEKISEEKRLSNDRNLKRINRIITTIQENFIYKLSLADLAEQEGLDMYYLSHFIKKYLGLSFQQYVNRLRLDKAVELLLKTDKKKIDICMESGFSDYRYLCKAFSEEYKCTPTQFRERYQGEIDPQNDIDMTNDQYIIMGDEKSFERFFEYLQEKQLYQQVKLYL